jgi:D-glycero-alpha-D-manno-heptose-7-phosphate kinase
VIEVRSPLRLPLGGGGTDLRSHADRHGAGWVAAALDLAVTVAVGPPGPSRPPSAVGPPAPLVAAALAGRALDAGDVAVAITSPVAAGTGLGSSGAVAVALVLALDRVEGRPPRSAEDLAAAGHAVEEAAVGPTAGYQDPWIAALGGLRWFAVAPGEAVTHRPLAIDEGTRAALAGCLGLYALGGSRSSAALLADQHRRTTDGEPAMAANLARTAALGVASREALEAGDLAGFGRLLHEHWCTKRGRSPGMSTDAADRAYDAARAAGAWGGKVVGAGGTGHLLVSAPDQGRVALALAPLGMRRLPLAWSERGAEVVSG